jgi:hypothetical protein
MNIKNILGVTFASLLLGTNSISRSSQDSSNILARRESASVPRLEEIARYPGVTNDASVSEIYSSSNKIFGIKGDLKSDFEVLREFGRDYELVAKVGECLTNSAITVKKQANEEYTYLNKSSKTRLNFRVLYDKIGEDYFVGLYHFKGQKFFFDFEALGYLESRRTENNGINFNFGVYLGKHNFLVNKLFRFLAGLAESEAKETVARLDGVYSQLMKNSRENLAILEKHRDPKANPFFNDAEFEKLRRFFGR